MPSAKFRAGTAAIIINSNGEVLAFKRTDEDDGWQLPQGGLNTGEEAYDGMLREVFEETGLLEEDLELVAEYPAWLAYEFPKKYRLRKFHRGQTHKWYLLRIKIEYSDLILQRATDEEFDDWQWMSMSELCRKTVDFKLAVYRLLLAHFADYIRK